jgi:hypothetical protein
VSELHLFEFEELGFFAARDKEHAFALCLEHTGMTAEDLELEDDFKRQVPDDEEINVGSEDSWEDPRETTKLSDEGVRPFTLYFLKQRASEWAAEHFTADKPGGYAFGGSD